MDSAVVCALLLFLGGSQGQRAECPTFKGRICDMTVDSVIDIETDEVNGGGGSEGHKTDWMDVFSCRNSCWKQEGCTNYTFFEHEERLGQFTYKCILFQRCQEQAFCATCETGPADCSLTAKQSNQAGIDPGFWQSVAKEQEKVTTTTTTISTTTATTTTQVVPVTNGKYHRTLLCDFSFLNVILA